MNTRTTILLMVAFLLGGFQRQAGANACQPIIDANKAQWKAPMVHDRKVMDSGFTLETIKVGDAMYMKSTGGWRVMSPAMIQALTDVATIEKAGLELKDCKQIGTEKTLHGESMRVYSFTTVAGQSSGNGKVWIGKDGLPYRMEAAQVKGNTAYTGVQAPVVGK